MVRLSPMSAETYRQFLDWAISDYASEQVRAGEWQSEKSDERARAAFDQLLPDGLQTPNQFLFTIDRESDGQTIGYLWYGTRKEGPSSFAALYDFVIFDAHRRQGYGSAALRLLEDEVRARGLDRILLHVFGHNSPARALYARMGYREKNITMIRELPERS